MPHGSRWPRCGSRSMREPLGFSGRIARAFQGHPLTPVLALAGLLLGLAAVLVTPREEEPQIDVTMANVRSEEHTSELQSLMRISYAVFCLKKKKHLRDITQ